MSNIGSVSPAPQSAAVASQGKVQAAHKEQEKAAVKAVESTGKAAPQANQDPSRGQTVDIQA
jgi:hypothetical protein